VHPTYGEPLGYSTSHAYHGVMEAMHPDYNIHIFACRDDVLVALHDRAGWAICNVEVGYEGRSIEETTAHAVCAAMWMAMQNE
jgi:hypothetical protein